MTKLNVVETPCSKTEETVNTLQFIMIEIIFSRIDVHRKTIIPHQARHIKHPITAEKQKAMCYV